MSGFHEVRFPTDVGYGASGGPRFSTQVVEAASGFEQRNINWAQARARYNAGTAMTSEQALAELVAFFRARMGRAFGFRFKDWSDYASGTPGAAPSPVDQLIGIGDGTQTTFQLIKTYAPGADAHIRTITKPVDGSVRIAVNAGEMMSGWSVDTTTGMVVFDTAPADGNTIQAGFEFDVPVRFDSDVLDVSLETFNACARPRTSAVKS